MKPTAYFIKSGRAELVNQEEMVTVLRECRIAGAGLDVFVHKPLAATDPLTNLDNVILNPHWLPKTNRAVRFVSVAMVEGILRAEHGLASDNVVNKEVLERPGFKQKLARFETNAKPLD
jgi:D-3-phosphoglycerate dehydrogenase